MTQSHPDAPSSSTSISKTRTLSVLVENSPGVLARISSLFSRRGYNIDSLAVGPTENPNFSRMTIVINVEDHALEQVIRNGKIVPGLKTAPIAIIPEDLLPSDTESRDEVLKLVGVMMNRVEKIVRGMTKGDIKNLIKNDFIDKKNIDNSEYQQVMADSSQMELSTIRELVSKVKQESLTELQNKKFLFKQYTVSELNAHKVDRETTETEVTWAVVTSDKTYETLGKAIGNMIERSCTKAHVIFHFKNYEDVKLLRSKTEDRIAKFMKTSSVNLSYEFLEWKREE
jgi:acetolactate synthase small subunit